MIQSFEKLSNITKNIDNLRIPLNSEQRSVKKKKGLYPYFGANNILDYIDEYIFDEKILCIAEDGGSWGKQERCAFIYNGKCWVNNHAHVLIENGKAKLEYLMYYLNHADLSAVITGTTRGKLTRRELDNIKIALPPLEDQIRIANLLSRIEELIAKRKESIRLLDKFVKSTFLEMFGDPVRNEKGWEKVKIIEIGDVHGGLQVTWDREKLPIEVPYLRVANIYRDKLDLNKIKYIKVTKDELDRTKLKKGDILIVEGHGNIKEIGRSAVWDGSIVNCVHQNHLIRLRCNPQLVLPTYLSSFVNSPIGRMQMMKSGKTTSGLNTINTKNVKETIIALPSLSLQNKYIQIVDKIEKIKFVYQDNLSELKKLYGAVSQRAFGK